jgi:hypothetical protein
MLYLTTGVEVRDQEPDVANIPLCLAYEIYRWIDSIRDEHCAFVGRQSHASRRKRERRPRRMVALLAQDQSSFAGYDLMVRRVGDLSCGDARTPAARVCPRA